MSRNIYVYEGPGVSLESLNHTLETFEAFFPLKISPKQILNDPWEERATLLIIPGGADRPYVKSLGDRGSQKIRAFAKKGGQFLGICAGSYFAGAFCDFAKGTDNEIREKRELALFNGTVRGPILAPYSYVDDRGSRAAHLKGPFSLKTTAYYNGGGAFIDADPSHVLAAYDHEEELPAILKFKFGRGRVILSGVHFEFNPEKMPTDHPLLPDLEAGNLGRLEILSEVVDFFNLGS